MSRTVSAWVTSGGDFLGAAGPFPVGVPWWSEVEPVIAHLHHTLGVPVMVLRLLDVDGGDGSRDGHVTYHVEALRRPAPGLLTQGPLDDALLKLTGHEELRAPWARADGLREILGWASDTLAAAGRPVTGPVEQRRTWNLAGLFRLPTAQGPVWLKTTPHFAADEAAVISAFARFDPGLVPTVVGAGERRILLEHLPGEDCWDASPETITSAVSRLVAAQAAVAGLPGGSPPGLRDRRTSVTADQVRDLLDGEVARELTAEELAAARELLARWPVLDECGLPDTIVHGDFHPGNWRSDGGPPVVVDFADAHWGNPVLDGLRAYDYLPQAKRPTAARAWIDAWERHLPGCQPRRALAIAEPLAHLSYALRYQEFLDGIEPSEKIYHLGDPVGVIRNALLCASVPNPHFQAQDLRSGPE
ncbi:aminoglycoside phosphotransferase family protein [Streptomyces sp. NPDC048420]|uniref:aminoglycoside phosphotransferase family protein n=1 Tax=Streptomyces sp. NPDC048420 TaxID=3155755 RepID=UPI0034311CE0